MLKRRTRSLNSKLTKGPGSVCQTLGIYVTHNAISLNSSCIWITNSDVLIDQTQIHQGPRIGVDYADKDALLPWRFKLEKLYD